MTAIRDRIAILILENKIELNVRQNKAEECKDKMSTKRILSMIMAMTMILSVLSTGVFAADNTLDKNESMKITINNFSAKSRKKTQ